MVVLVAYDKTWVRALPLVPALTDTGHLTWRQRAVMASVEALSLTTTTALAYISAFLLLLPLRDLFVESFSGQGSYLRITAKLFVLGNLKNVSNSTRSCASGTQCSPTASSANPAYPPTLHLRPFSCQ
ncbi:hypothetical protein V8E51_018478 [Hyaloscypha variabilis]